MDTIDETRPIVTRAEAKAGGLKRFFTGKSCKYGHISDRFTASGMCTQCQRDKYAANPENERARTNAWRASNPDKAALHIEKWKKNAKDKSAFFKKKYYWRDREEHLARSKKYYEDNAEACRARASERYIRKRDEIIAYVKQWGKNNPDKLRAIQRTRKARKKGADGSHSAEDIQRIRDLQKDRCAICRKPLKAKGHVDHITPLAKGGSNWPSNLQLLCGRCNKLKSARDPIDFMQSLGRLL